MTKPGFNTIVRQGAYPPFYLPVFKSAELKAGGLPAKEAAVERYILSDYVYNIREPEDPGLRARRLTKVFVHGMDEVCYVPVSFDVLKEIFERHGRVFYTPGHLALMEGESGGRKKVGPPALPRPQAF